MGTVLLVLGAVVFWVVVVYFIVVEVSDSSWVSDAHLHRRKRVEPSHRRRWSERHTAVYAALLLSGVAAAVLGVLSLLHPIVESQYEIAHFSDAPPIFGVGFLLWPVILIGLAARRGWDELALDLEAWREHRERKSAGRR